MSVDTHLTFMFEQTLLTDREQEVLKLILQGYSDTDMAKALHTTVKTIGAHRHNIVNKLDGLGHDDSGGVGPTDPAGVPKRPYPGHDGAAAALPGDEAIAQTKIP
jgi:DNA-binding CsgD family transcriptional regulator